MTPRRLYSYLDKALKASPYRETDMDEAVSGSIYVTIKRRADITPDNLTGAVGPAITIRLADHSRTSANHRQPDIAVGGGYHLTIKELTAAIRRGCLVHVIRRTRCNLDDGATNEELIERCWLRHALDGMLEEQDLANGAVEFWPQLMRLEPWQQQILDAARSGRPAAIPPMRLANKETPKP